MAAVVLPLVDAARHHDGVSMLPSLQVDSITYHELATDLALGKGLDAIPVRQPPGFVMILAVVYKLFGPTFMVARVFLWCALVAVTLLSAWLARQVWGGTAAALAAMLCATSAALRYYVGTVQYEVFVGACLLGLLWLALSASAARSFRIALAWALVAGLAAGMLSLTREVFIGVGPLVGAWISWRRRLQGVLRASMLLPAFVTAMTLPIASWSMYQTARSGQFVVISDKGPVTFALGNNPRASGTYNVDVIEEPSGMAFVLQRPADAMRLAWRKILYFWGITRDGWNVPRPAPLWLFRATWGILPVDATLPLARGGLMLAAFVVGVVVMIRRRLLADWWILPGVVLAVCGAHALTLSSYRFSVPVLPVIIIVASGPLADGMAYAWRWVSWRRPRAIGALAVASLAIALQWAPVRSEFAYRAADIEALNAVDVFDRDAGRSVRSVTASAGPRAALILADEYLAAGPYQLLLTGRRGDAAGGVNTAVARVEVSQLSGAGCVEDVPAGNLPTRGFGKVWIPCNLPADGPTTLVVHALGVADLTFDEVAFVPVPPPPGVE